MTGQMEFNIVILVTLLASSHAVDPSACQHTLKFMLINACGATKREFNHSPHHQYSVMSKQEVEDRYLQMVKDDLIKGVEYQLEGDDVKFIDSNYIEGSTLQNILYRFKRSFMGLLNMKTLTDPIVHESRGGFRFVGQLQPEVRAPAPGALKSKCCREIYLCTLDDFKGFCG